jgi:hypothetical protein
MTTLERLRAWLADDANFDGEKRPFDFGRNVFGFSGVRKRFITTNGISISIQQSGSHYCDDENEVEMWHCPHSPLLMQYGDAQDPYAYVPLEVCAGYIDSLESLGDNHEYKTEKSE